LDLPKRKAMIARQSLVFLIYEKAKMSEQKAEVGKENRQIHSNRSRAFSLEARKTIFSPNNLL
jgi:hypothetical protein